MTTMVDLMLIRRDGGTQARAKIDPDTVRDYREALVEARTKEYPVAKGWPFPPLVVFYDGRDYHLADGFHRTGAAVAEGWFRLPCDVRQGTQRDAVLYAAGANADHGLRRTNEDKRRAVLRLLEDAEWGQWSDREIARRCKVSHPFVGFIRAELTPVTGNITSERAYTTKHGTVATMKTGNIGGSGGSGDDALTAAERQTQLNERAYYWLAEYTDQWDRTWRELEPNQVHHANSPCYQAFVRQFPSDRDHKFALKSALARLNREDADDSNVVVFDDPVDALRAHAAKGSRSAESVYRTLASFDASGHEYAMGLAIEDTGLPPSDIRQAAAELLADLESDAAKLVDTLESAVATAVSPAPIVESYNGTAYRRETITNGHGQTETRWQPVTPAPSLIDGPLNQMRQALSVMKYPGDHARVFRQWQQAPDTKREDGMMFGAIARLLEILVDELEKDREVPMT